MSGLPRPAAPALLFLHIPKAAGTTFFEVLHRQYGAANTFIIGQDVRGSLAALQQLPAERRAQLRLVTGHMAFGVHQHLPQPSTYVTLLRHPVARVVSTYHFIRRTPEHRHYPALSAPAMDLERFVCSGLTKIGTDNGQVRLLAGVDDVGAALPFGACSDALLAQAQANLRRHFTVVGVSEMFDESLLLMRRRLRWRWPFYQRRNVRPDAPAKPAMPAATRAVIERQNRFDLALYAEQRRRLEAELRAQGPGFWLELRLFRWLNRRFQRRALAGAQR